MKKTFIISFQKSGTYLISEILENLGYKKTLIHIDRSLREVHQIYKKQKLSKGEIVFERKDFKLRADKLINNLQENYFAVGHIWFNLKSKEILSKHKLILTKRNIKTSLISMMNFKEDKKRMTKTDLNTWHLIEDPKEKFCYFLKEYGLGFIRYNNNLLPWIYEDLLTIKFENIIDHSKGIKELKKISHYLKVNIDDYKKILEKSFETYTVTKSFRKVDFNYFWSQPAEILFNQIGGNILNEKLGYK